MRCGVEEDEDALMDRTPAWGFGSLQEARREGFDRQRQNRHDEAAAIRRETGTVARSSSNATSESGAGQTSASRSAAGQSNSEQDE
jgi:hypothetical protein